MPINVRISAGATVLRQNRVKLDITSENPNYTVVAYFVTFSRRHERANVPVSDVKSAQKITCTLGHWGSENNALLLCYKYQHGKTLESSGSLSSSLSVEMASSTIMREKATGSQVIAPSTDNHGHKRSSLLLRSSSEQRRRQRTEERRHEGEIFGDITVSTGRISPRPLYRVAAWAAS